MRVTRRTLATLICLVSLSAVWPSNASASASFQLLFESNANAAPGVEVFIQGFDSLADLLNQNPSSGAFTPIDVSGNFSIHGLAHDGNQFHMLFESDANAAPGVEVFIQSFDSLTDLLNQNPSSGAFSPIDVSGNFSIGGLAHDGNQFHMLFESDANAAPGAEVFIQSFDSLADLLNQNPSSGTFTPIDVSGNFSIHGLAHDGGQFHMLFESDANAAPGVEVFIQSFDSLTDLLNQNPSSGTFTPIDVSGNFSIGGLAAIKNPGPPGGGGSGVPEIDAASSTLAVALLMAIIGFIRERRAT